MSAMKILADRCRSGKPTLAAWCGLPDPAVAGLLAREGFDAVVIDMQHGAIDFAAAIKAIPLVAAAGKPAIPRIPVGEFATASRLLDAGAAAVIAPMINSVEDARRFGGFMKYPPLGQRSWGPHAALTLSGLGPADYFAQANGMTLAFAMIETREALADLDGILAAPEIDGIFIGPSDLSIALSDGAENNPTGPTVTAAIDHALARTKAAGKFAGIFGLSGEQGGALARKGFDLVSIGTDTGFLRAGAQEVLAAAR